MPDALNATVAAANATAAGLAHNATAVAHNATAVAGNATAAVAGNATAAIANATAIAANATAAVAANATARANATAAGVPLPVSANSSAVNVTVPADGNLAPMQFGWPGLRGSPAPAPASPAQRDEVGRPSYLRHVPVHVCLNPFCAYLYLPRRTSVAYERYNMKTS